MNYCLVLLFFVYCTVCRSGSVDNVSNSELNALYDLYNATGGSNWNWNTSAGAGAIWNFSVPNPNPCYPLWQGLTCECNNNQCAVAQIALDNFNLTGSLPDSIGALTNLTTLSLTHNSIEGPVVRSMGNLTSLIDLNLAFNQFTGTLHESVLTLSQLEHLDLESNDLFGVIPSIGDLVNLKRLNLGSNCFEGDLPESIAALTNLTDLILAENCFDTSIPTTLGSLVNLIELDLSNNFWNYTLPGDLCRLKNLTYFYLENNDVDGELPSCIGNFTNMVVLQLYNNFFEYPIPESILNLTKLVELNLGDNFFSGVDFLLKANLTDLAYLNLGINSIYGRLDDITLSNLIELDVSYNRFSGTLPSSVFELPFLSVLDVSANDLSGRLPENIGNAINLTDLNVNFNVFVGSIPSSLGNLINLVYLGFEFNFFTEILPDMSALTKLRYLTAGRNPFHRQPFPNLCNALDMNTLFLRNVFLEGTIPNCIGNWTKMEVLDLRGNILTGSIPESIGNINRMYRFYLYSNRLTGSIPSGICNMKFLQLMLFYDNQLNGTIPACVTNLTILDELQLYENQLSGSVPMPGPSMNCMLLYNNSLSGSLPPRLFKSEGYLYEIYLDNNKLTGQIPPIDSYYLESLDLSNNSFSGTFPNTTFNQLGYLDFSYNHLHGPFPFLIDDIFLEDLVLSYNSFTGPIPNISRFAVPETFEVNDNYFTGTFPAVFCERDTYANTIDLSYNSLHGALPSCMPPYVTYLSIGNNRFSGTLPHEWGGSLFLETLTINDNLFSGSLPAFNKSINLEFLYLQNNNFDGKIENFNSSVQYIDFSNNQFTGRLPEDFFNSAVELISFAAASNCITGTLPESICNLTSLVFLDLDGLSTAKTCRSLIFPHSKKLTSFTLPKQITGGIPECYFAMPDLQTLHLSGNSIEWSFPEYLEISAQLTSMSLAHNKITGTIPVIIQNRVWELLDLSYNKLVGELNIVPQNSSSSLTLNVNRLSGAVPSSVLNMNNVTILTGNLFGCDLHRTALPVHDPAYRTYQCGSDSFNQAAFIWSGFALAMFGFVILAWYYNSLIVYCQKMWASVLKYLKVFDNEKDNERLHSFQVFVLGVRNSIFYLTVGICVVFLPVFSALTEYYKTVQHQYAWTVSAAFLSGVVPGVILLICFIGFFLALFAEWLRYTQISSTENVVVEVQKRNYTQFFVLSTAVIFNCIVMIFINGIYVIIVLNYSTKVIFAAQVLTALFKVLWNDFAVRGLMIFARKLVAFIRRRDEIWDERKSVDVEMPFMTFIVLFNSIIAPCLATAAVDSNCFVNVFIAPATVTTKFPIINSDVTCDTKKNTTYCTDTVTESFINVSYDPPFIYSYQCSSSILTNYASVYVFMFIMVAFIKPIGLYLLTKLHHLSNLGPGLRKLVDITIYNLLKPANVEDLNRQVLFRKERFVLRTVGKVAVFVTFGVIFPPLAVVLCVAFNSESYLNLLIIGRFLSEIKDPDINAKFKEKLSRDCEQCMDLLLVPLVRLVVPFAGLFYGLFVFDIYGDQMGFKRSIWAPCLLVMTPVFLWLGYSVSVRWLHRNDKTPRKGEKMQVEDALEMSIVPNPIRMKEKLEVESA